MTYTTDDGIRVVYNDPRRFGTLRYEPRDAVMARLACTLGVEPLSEQFTTQALAQLLATSRAPIKAALLNQKLVAGLGNIYVDEALFLARLHPLSPSNAVPRARIKSLRDAIVSRLTEAIDVGGINIA